MRPNWCSRVAVDARKLWGSSLSSIVQRTIESLSKCYGGRLLPSERRALESREEVWGEASPTEAGPAVVLELDR